MATRKPREYFQLTQDDKIVIKKMEILTSAVEKVYPSAKMLMWRSFVQGIFVAVGLIVGLSIVLAILLFVLTQLTFIAPISNLLKSPAIEKVLPENK